MRIKKRNKIIMVLCAVIVAISVTVVPSVFALQVVPNGGEGNPYYILVGAKEYDFVKCYVDNNTNTVLWVFERDITALALFNDYNGQASGMFNSFQNVNVNIPNTNNSFLIGAFIDATQLPQETYINMSGGNVTGKFYFNDTFNTASKLAITGVDSSYAFNNIPHMTQATQYWRDAMNVSENYKPCILLHLSQSFSIDYFTDYAVIGAGINLISDTREQAYESGFDNGYIQGFAKGETKGEINKETEKEFEYERGKADGEREYIENVLPVEREEAYDEGYSDGEINYIQNFLPTKENIAFENGYRKGKLEVGNNSFYDLLTAVFDVPVETITGLLNFDLMGTNMKNLFLSFLSLAVIICIARWLI